MTNNRTISDAKERIVKMAAAKLIAGRSEDGLALTMALDALDHKSAKWIKLEDEILIPNECSNCGVRTNRLSDYCPCCGSMMEVDKDAKDT